ncbi:MAG: OmpA family protein [Pararhodobacter sp.]
MEDAETPVSDPPETLQVRQTRLYRRADIAAPFLPYGFVPLAGLALLLFICLTVIAFNVVQATARETAARALAASGEEWARFSVSGQWVRLEGTAPTPEAARRATEAVRRVSAPTWAGDARPVTRVDARFSIPPASSAPQSANSILSARTAEAPPEYLFRRSGSQLTLDGRIPGEPLRSRLLEAARGLQASAAVTDITDHMELHPGDAPEGFEALALQSLDLLAACERGTSSYVDNAYSLHCEAEDEAVAALTERASADLPEGVTSDIDILSREAVLTCEAELASLLEATRMEFDSGSATIQIASGPVLDLTAHAAADCPGTLRVEGHTDNTGSLELNQTLSLLRAEAVRAALIHRGVPSDRLIAEGYGPTRPIGDNATPEGRASNRRIELSIVRPAE